MKRGILSLFLTIGAVCFMPAPARCQTSVTLDANNNVRNSVTNFSHTNNHKLFVDGAEITGAPSFPNEVANTILAGPSSGAAAQPTFRALVGADIPNLAESQITGLVADLAGKANDSAVVHNTGNENVVGVKTFTSLFVLPSQNANLFYSGPSSGSPAAPAFRAMVASDVPALPWSKITSGLPTSLSGYGITDGVNTSDSRLSDDRTANAVRSLTAHGIDNSVDPTDGQIFYFDAASGKFKFQTLAGGGNVSGSGLTSGDVIQGSGGTTITDGGFSIADIARLSISDIFTNVSAPSTPSSGKTTLYFDSTSKNISAKNDAGTVNHGVQTQAAVSHKAISSIADNGAVTVAQYSATDLADFSATEASSAGQIPIFDGSKYVPGDPLVQGLFADGSTSAANPVAIGAYDTAGTPALHRLIALASAPAGTESALVVRNIPGGTQTVSGTVTTSPPSNASTNIAQINGVTPLMGAGNSGTGSPRVTIASDQAAIPVTGTFWQATQPVSGTFWQATQPVSIADGSDTTLGAKADAKNTATDTTAVSVVSLLKEISAMEQAPASRVVTQSSGANLHVNVDSAPTTAVTGTFWQTTQPVSGTVTSNIGTTNGLALDSSVNGVLVAQASTTSGQSGPLIQGAVTTSVPSYTTAKTSPLSLTPTGNLRVDGSTVTQPVSGTFWQATQPVSGTVTTTPPSNASSDVAQINGVTPLMGAGNGGTGSLRVNVASDQLAIPVTGTFWQATQPVSGTVTTTPPSNASSNVAQINGVTPLMGAGNGGTGSLRVNVASDQLTIPVTPQATESFLGFVGGKATSVSANFTRPADTNVYASGDLVANSVTAASVVPLSWTVARINDSTGMIRRVRLKISGTVITNASFRVHLYQNDPSASSGIANGDNGVWSTKEAGYLGSCDVTIDKAFTDGAEGVGTPNNGTEINFIPKSGTQTIYGLIEARAAFTPISAEVFTATLETLQN
jgi:hypothetical protein